VIDVESLTVRFGRRVVLAGVSLRLVRRQILGLIGPPESGKSTLLKAIASLVRPASGRIRFGDQCVDELDTEHRRAWQRRIGMAFQNDALFDALTVFDNVAFPLRRRGLAETEVSERVTRRLDEVGLTGARDSVPSSISGGMRKRVGIARATVTEPEIGLFDEPIAGLDPVSSSRILDLIVRLTELLGMATVIVSNDLPVLLPICDRVAMLHGGSVVYDGDPAGLAQSRTPAVVQFATGADEGPL
jgi:phospholipid/cholesterol/gamma-HCH transport system ATP-binding protein